MVYSSSSTVVLLIHIRVLWCIFQLFLNYFGFPNLFSGAAVGVVLAFCTQQEEEKLATALNVTVLHLFIIAGTLLLCDGTSSTRILE